MAMIEKILNIQNVGRFCHFCGKSDELTFKRNTFIFGKNTHGKSTLVSILRSASDFEPDFIVGRKTFDKDTAQNVVIKSGSLQTVFNGTEWDRYLFDIKIFDSRYISENIYSEDYFVDGTVKQDKIVNIILGSEGRQLEIKYDEAKEKLEKNSGRKREITNQYNKSFTPSTIPFDIFRSLPFSSSTNDELSRISAEIEAIKNQQTIKTILERILSESTLADNIDKNALNKTIEINQKIIEEHIGHNLNKGTGALRFFTDGLSLLKRGESGKDRNCIFCGQIMGKNAEELIAAFNLILSEEYKNLSSAVGKSALFLKDWNIEQKILSAQVELEKYGIKSDFTEIIKKITGSRKSCLSELEKKQEDLNYKISTEIFNPLNESIEETQKYLKSILLKYENPIDINELNDLRKKRDKLDVSKKRNEKIWSDLCEEYKKLEEDFKTNLKPTEERLFEAKKEYAENIFRTYGGSINDILKKLGANYELIDFIAPQNRRDELRIFSITFLENNAVIPIDGQENEYNFKNTLSDSDKRVLAFAFFVSDIKKCDGLENKIVVLDDPMSSLDKDRKIRTVKVIRDDLQNESGNKPGQIIILTHEESFFKFLNEYFKEDKKFLRISYSPTEKNSELIPCDINEEFLKEEHFKRLDGIRHYLEKKIDDIDLADLRIILEHVIERKYYLNIPDEVRDSGGIVGWYTEYKKDEKLKIKINDLLPHLTHHDQSNDIKEEEIEDSDKRSIVDDFLKVLVEI